MDLLMVLSLKFCVLLILLGKGYGSCVFPANLTGTWRSSRWNDIVFNVAGTEFTIASFQGQALTFECDNIDGTKYIVRSTTPRTLLSNFVEVAACLDFTSYVNGIKYIYYHATNDLVLDDGTPEPVRLVVPGETLVPSVICDITSYSTGSNDIMIDFDYLGLAAEMCPIPLLANFDDYTVSPHSGGTQCNGAGYINICDDRQTVIVDYDYCSTKIFFSNGGNLSCVHSTQSGNIYYVNLLNNDASVDHSTYYHYTCLVVELSTNVKASQWPKKCHSSQTPTSVPTDPGATFTLNSNLTCVPQDPTTQAPEAAASSGGGFNIIFAVIPVAVILILLLVACVILAKMGKLKKLPCFKKKNNKDNKVNPNAQSVPMSKMDSQRTGLQATALVLPTDRAGTVTPLERRNLETAQSTRSATAITISHMEEAVMEDHQTPRRLPPLEPKPNNPLQDSATSDTPSMSKRMSLINESLLGATDTAGDLLNGSNASKSGVPPEATNNMTLDNNNNTNNNNN